MKIKKLLVALLVIALIPLGTLFAQRTAGSWTAGAFVGTGMPMSPEFFKDYWKSGGIGFGGEFIMNLSEKISLGGRYQHINFPLDEDEMMSGMPIPAGATVSIEGGNIKVDAISANIFAYLTQPDAMLGFYITGGGSYYLLSAGDLELSMEYQGQTFTETQEIDEMDNKFGINGGAGIEIGAGGTFNIFAEGRYNYLFGKEEGPPDTEDGNISFLSFVGGVRVIF